MALRAVAQRLVACVFLIFASTAQLWAEDNQDFEALFDAIRLDDTVEMMREEGIAYGTSLIVDMMIDADTPGWQIRLGQIYDTGKMRDLLASRLQDEMADADLTPILALFGSDLGAEIIELELKARKLVFDESVEMAARERFEELSDENAQIVTQINGLISDSDLIEYNVMGILNSNLMLYRGLADGGALDLGEEDILTDVWMSEESVREESKAWIEGYFLTAYQSLDPDDLDAYAAFWRTEDGAEFNRALFAVFDQMYEELSYLLGRAAAQHMQGEDL